MSKKIINNNIYCVVLMGSLGAVALVRNLVYHNISVVGISKRDYLLKTRMDDSFLINSNDEINAIINKLSMKYPSKPLVLTDSDDYVEFLLKNYDQISNYCIIPYSKNATHTENLMNKSLLYKYADSLSVNIPKTYDVEGDLQLFLSENIIDFPVVVKPSKQLSQVKDKAMICNNIDELQIAYQTYKKHTSMIVVQEYVDGPVDQQYCITSYKDASGKIHIGNIVKKVRQFPSLFGIGSCHITCYNQDIVDLTNKILEGSDYFGITMIEFKYSPKKNKYFLIEVNCRFPIEMQINNFINRDFIFNVFEDQAIGTSSFLDNKEIEKSMNHTTVWINGSYDIRACRSNGINFVKEYYNYSRKYRIAWSVYSTNDMKFVFAYAKNLLKKLF